MIPNLKEKLAQITVEQSSEKEINEVPLDLECSEYTNEFDSDYLVGEMPIAESCDIDYNILSNLCMEGSEHNLSKSDIVYFDTETTGLGSGVSTVAF